MKKLKEDNAIAVRTDRQQSELRAPNAGTIRARVGSYLYYNKIITIASANISV